MPKQLDPLGQPDKRDEYMKGLAQELEAFLLFLQGNTTELAAYVNDPVAFLHKPRITKMLSDQAKLVLLQSDYGVVQEIMGYRESTAVRWVCIWVI